MLKEEVLLVVEKGEEQPRMVEKDRHPVKEVVQLRKERSVGCVVLKVLHFSCLSYSIPPKHFHKWGIPKQKGLKLKYIIFIHVGLTVERSLNYVKGDLPFYHTILIFNDHR